ncbi:MAG: phosphatase PAP2 family protein [Proteobacteria bacterium]|nr:phosphatase PAP2 family protein [Pseudomonadota bacterium]
MMTSILTYTRIQWGIVFLMLLVEFVWIKLSSFTFVYDQNIIIAYVISFSLIYLVYVWYQRFRPDPKILNLLQSTSLFLAFCPLMLGFSYLGAMVNQPLIDATLVSIDSHVGVHTPSVVFWFRNHKIFYLLFEAIYNTYLLQFPFIILYFGLSDENVSLQRYIMQFMIATPLTILISIFYPATGPYTWYQYTPSPELLSALKHLLDLRQHILDITIPDGIVTMPSFHATMACIDAYAFRRQRKIIFIPILILNILVVFSCIPIGQHYFADILGGIAVFFVVIAIESFLFNYVNRKAPSSF